MITIGLTGGIATGKSLVSQLLEGHGGFLINADVIAHELYAPRTEGFSQIVSLFGEDILTPSGSIDRKKLGSVVFSDTSKMEALNSIIHPLIRHEVKTRISDLYEQNCSVVILEAALLLEAGWQDLVDQIWVVISERNTVISRLSVRNALSREESLKRIQAQMPQDERLKFADVVIENNGNIDSLSANIKKLWLDKLAANIRR